MDFLKNVKIDHPSDADQYSNYENKPKSDANKLHTLICEDNYDYFSSKISQIQQN